MAGTSRGGIEMDFMIGKRRSSPKPTEDSPFRILVLGPLSGENRKSSAAKPMRVDVTELDDLIGRLSPKVTLDMADGTAIEVSFEELDDFHPDALFDRLPVFKAMRQLRRELQDPKTFQRAAAALREVPEPTPSTSSAVESAGEADGDMMERLLGKAPAAAPKAQVPTGIDAFVRQLVAPHVVQGPHPEQAVHLSALDKATGELMRSILHHPKFQSLEAAWRGLDFLLRGVEAEMELAVLDMFKDDLGVELSGDDPCVTPFGKCLIGEAGAPEPPWALLVGAFTFGPSDADAALMQRLAVVLAAAGVPLLSAADPSLAAHDAPPDWSGWQELRQRPEAAMIGLALPRFLLRLPYGEQTDEVDRFAFEEQTEPPEPPRYLWGNPAFLVATLLGRSFAQAGWAFSPGDTLSINGLPAHTVRVDGELAQTPCAEVWMSHSAAETLLAQGFVPVCSVRGRDAVQLLRIQSMAEPLAALAGRWK